MIVGDWVDCNIDHGSCMRKGTEFMGTSFFPCVDERTNTICIFCKLLLFCGGNFRTQQQQQHSVCGENFSNDDVSVEIFNQQPQKQKSINQSKYPTDVLLWSLK
ncbi:putative DnaJ domain protein [Trichinella spiralis]|uniref:Uncharacterized protein n=1 Tax=Trichinella spiralis TaxID=6334 RepID=E5SUX5_TRISP|nr:putative DnaJ domain protein [Trichinella spiralis]KRY29318.1 hypothetical protein T01_14373 [Trichinella spiralis]